MADNDTGKASEKTSNEAIQKEETTGTNAQKLESAADKGHAVNGDVKPAVTPLKLTLNNKDTRLGIPPLPGIKKVSSLSVPPAPKPLIPKDIEKAPEPKEVEAAPEPETIEKAPEPKEAEAAPELNAVEEQPKSKDVEDSKDVAVSNQTTAPEKEDDSISKDSTVDIAALTEEDLGGELPSFEKERAEKASTSNEDFDDNPIVTAIGECKTMTFEMLDDDYVPPNIGECKTMAFDFGTDDIDEKINNMSSPAKPIIEFDEGESKDDDEDSIHVSPSVKPVSSISINSQPSMQRVNRPIIQEDDDIIRSSELDAISTYEEEGFKKSLFFERAISRWENASKYELPKIGDTVANYQIEALLGQGGFGAVYRVKNLTLGREEALKLILPSAKQDVNNIDKRFKREVDCVSRLEHPNIVRLYSSGTLSQGILWMTMELVKGKNLEKIMGERRLTFFEAKEIMEQILCGLQDAHQLKLIHRDLKPANIMITDKSGFDGLVVILDFGLAKALGADEDASVQELTCVDDSKRVYGTPQYMAPEQLQTGVPGPWTDVYAAGLMLIELITGHPAVQGNTALELAFRQIHEPLILPPRWEGTAIGAVITKATAKSPKDRYKDAGEFCDALRHIKTLTDPVSVLSEPLPETSKVKLSTLTSGGFSSIPVQSTTSLKQKDEKNTASTTRRSTTALILGAFGIIGWIGFLVFMILYFLT